MRDTFFQGVGGVLSADIAVPDHERELQFYSSVLTTGENPLWQPDLMNNRGVPVIGLGARTPEYDELPLQWMPHFQVSDVAASVAAALELGGKELMHGKNEAGESLWAGVEDSAGAAFGLIPIVSGEAAYEKNDQPMGHIAWLSLAVSNAAAASQFYEKVVGWNAKLVVPPEQDCFAAQFEMLASNQSVVAEIQQLQDNSISLPSAWLLYLPVGDLAESLRRVRDNGGEVIQEFQNPACAVVRDPVGVHFALQDGTC